MIRKTLAGLTALGVIGGAGSVVWHGNTATIKVKDANGVTHSTTITGGGRTYSCPAGEHDKLAHFVEAAGRIKITQQENPARHDELVPAYNAQVDAYNAALESDCSAE